MTTTIIIILSIVLLVLLVLLVLCFEKMSRSLDLIRANIFAQDEYLLLHFQFFTRSHHYNLLALRSCLNLSMQKAIESENYELINNYKTIAVEIENLIKISSTDKTQKNAAN
ncbi:MAG: hypothetical protein LBM08_00835 [Dysgonamonadaceae bacterium]|jgi:hypothetical protein|nr:hypothetical protein [Dysgonamonadaceae bacterium]